MSTELTTKERLLKELRAASAEAIACCLFVYFGAGSVCGAKQAVGLGPVEPVNYALAFGLLITCLAFAIGSVSGGHINPAVTLAMAVTQNITPTRAILYFFAQCIGALAGGALLYAAVGKDSYYSGIGLASDITPGMGLVHEFMGTLLLIFVVFNVAVWTSKPLESDFGGSVVSSMAPLPIGFAVLCAHLTLGPFTGCGINPARVLGAVVFEENFWDGDAGKAFWIYWVGPFLASFVGPLLYFALFGTVKPGNTSSDHPDAVKEFEG